MMFRVLILLLALSGSAAAADLLGPPDLPVPKQAPGAPAAAEPVSIQAFGDREPGCQEWTDACRTCSRGTDGAPMCSNIGPACQPQEIKCARPKEPTKP